LGTWTPEQVATHLGVDVDAVQKLVDEGRLRTLPVRGGGWVTTEAAVQAATSPRRRRRPRRRPTNAVVAAPTTKSPAPRREPVAQQPAQQPAPPAVPAVPAVPAPRSKLARRTPIDIRPDVPADDRLDMRAAAERLGITADEALRLAQQGKLRATQLGRQWVTTGRDVRAYGEAQPRRRKAVMRSVA
jgi:excisionase family DNA binding protein